MAPDAFAIIAKLASRVHRPGRTDSHEHICRRKHFHRRVEADRALTEPHHVRPPRSFGLNDVVGPRQQFTSSDMTTTRWPSHSPSGPRNVDKPDSTLIPAPVNTTSRTSRPQHLAITPNGHHKQYTVIGVYRAGECDSVKNGCRPKSSRGNQGRQPSPRLLPPLAPQPQKYRRPDLIAHHHGGHPLGIHHRARARGSVSAPRCKHPRSPREAGHAEKRYDRWPQPTHESHGSDRDPTSPQ